MTEPAADAPPAPVDTLDPGADEPAAGGVSVSGDGDEGAPLGARSAAAIGETLRQKVDEEAARSGDVVEADPRYALGLEPAPPELLAGTPYGPCPICEGFGCVDPDVALKALNQIVAEVAPFPQSTVFDRCPECEGWGSVLTGSRRGDSGIQPCPACDGQGFTDKRQAGTIAPAAPPVEGSEAPPVFAQLPDPMRLPPSRGGQPPAPGMEWDDTRTSWVYPT